MTLGMAAQAMNRMVRKFIHRVNPLEFEFSIPVVIYSSSVQEEFKNFGA